MGGIREEAILISEDADVSFLRKIVSQWPEIERNVAFFPGNGFKNLPTPEQAKELHDSLGGKFKIIVHRDRDALTDDEVTQITEKYRDLRVDVWFPKGSDVEAYFCFPEFIEWFLGCTLAVAEGHVADVLAQSAIPVRQQFDKQRASHNEENHKQGGSPTNEDVWASFQARELRGGKGKFVLGQLKNRIGQQTFSPEKILASKLNGQVAVDLKHMIEQVLA